MKEICTNCIWFANNYFRFGGGVSYWCLHKNLSGKRKIKSQLVYNKEKPDWCPGFTEPPEQPSEEIKRLFNPKEGESMKKYKKDPERQLANIKCELERKYYHLFDKDSPKSIAQITREVLHKQRVAIIDSDNKIKDLEEKMENLFDKVMGVYVNKKDFGEDIVDVTIDYIEEQKRIVKSLRDKMDKIHEYIAENYSSYWDITKTIPEMAIKIMEDKKDEFKEKQEMIDKNDKTITELKRANDRLADTVKHLQKEREWLQKKLTVMNEKYINDMSPAHKLKTQPSFVVKLSDEKADKFLEELKDYEKIELAEEDILAKEVTEVKAYLDHKYPEFYEEHGRRRFSDIIKLLVLKLDG